MEKTKAMKVWKDADTNHINASDQPIDNIKQFKYLGSIITDGGGVRSRIGQATSVFKRIDKVWKSTKISLKERSNYTILLFCQQQFMHVKPGKLHRKSIKSSMLSPTMLEKNIENYILGQSNK